MRGAKSNSNRRIGAAGRFSAPLQFDRQSGPLFLGWGIAPMGRANEAGLYVVVGAGVAPAGVEALLAAAPVAALLITSDNAPLEAARAKPLVDLAQARGVAALIEADAALARTLRADGVHLPWSKDIVARYETAREILGGRFIVGTDAGRLRDDAMTLGEAGADYVGFGIPAHVEDRETARARQLDLVAWWGEVFQPPCVAFNVETVEDGARLAAAGADFVALKPPSTGASADLVCWAKAASRALATAEDVA
jgi:thiamine-phosphate pyrophosphorylase